MASFGHSDSHAPQLMQSWVMYVAMFLPVPECAPASRRESPWGAVAPMPARPLDEDSECPAGAGHPPMGSPCTTPSLSTSSDRKMCSSCSMCASILRSRSMVARPASGASPATSSAS